jgi:hypothetical protein
LPNRRGFERFDPNQIMPEREDLMPEFVGPGTPLTQQGITAAAASLGVGAAELWAVMSVETSGCGFLPDKRPKILFERHLFHRLTDGEFDGTNPGVSDPAAGGYGAAGAHQHDRLAEAIDLDRAAALQSASWGLGQILGENFAAAGFADAETMAQAMTVSEDQQLMAMASFINANGMSHALAQHDCAGFARRYNGPAFEQNQYDRKLRDFFARFSGGTCPISTCEPCRSCSATRALTRAASMECPASTPQTRSAPSSGRSACRKPGISTPDWSPRWRNRRLPALIDRSPRA